MKPESEVWLRQADADVLAARDSLEAGHFEWVSFQAQQSAEKALKAFLLEMGVNPEHVRRLRHSLHGAGSALEACLAFDAGFSALEAQLDLLNQHSIAPRYPDAVTVRMGMAPVDYYDRAIARQCLSGAITVIEFVKKAIP